MPEKHVPLPPRILVIDDQEKTRYVFQRILTRAGYQVVEAATGAEGLTLAQSAPDLIIADVNLPDMLGYDLCRRLKADSATAGIPLLQISAAFISDESKAQALQGGADSYLVQPIEPAVLIAQVTALLRLRKAESLSSLAARQWQSTFDSLTDGLALSDPQGTVLRTNRTFLKLLDIAASQVEDKDLARFFEETFGMPLSAFRAQEGPDGHEVQYKDRWLRIRHNQITNALGQNGGSILLLTDITEHKKLQETLKMSERLAATGRLAHIIAHEINNPLEALSNLLYLMELNEALPDEPRDHLMQATHELDRISQITKQILAFHRESRAPMHVSPREVVEGVLAMYRARMITSNVASRTSFRCAEPVPLYPGEIRQALSNLISNAMDALEPAGSGILYIACVPGWDIPSGRRGVRLILSDTGPGIAADVQQQVFGAFFTTKDTNGSGIGLWLTSEIIKKHNGRIRMRSRTDGPYRGTFFDVFLPVDLND